MGIDGVIVAHAGGLDELAMLLFPIIVGGGVYLMTRQPKKPKVVDADGAEVRSIRQRREPPPPRQRWGGSKTKP